MKIGNFSKNILFLLLAAAFICNTAFAASNAPTLQITNYATTPTDVYAGSQGYLQLTVTNTGSATANSINAQYTIAGITQTISAGDISAGSTGQLSIPFKISQNAAGTIQFVNVIVYYTSTSSSGQGNPSQQASLTIPITVLQQTPLRVNTLSTGSYSVTPGDKVAVELQLSNTGGVVNNLIISMPTNSTFSLDGTTQQQVGSIAPNTTVNVTLGLVSSSSSQIGSYSVPVVFTYQDALSKPTSDTLSVGPINVLESSTQYRLSLVPLTPTEIGSQAVFSLTVENTGSKPISAIMDVNSTSVFTPIGTQRVYLDSIAPGQSASTNVTLGIGASASAGYYTIPITLTTNSGQTETFNNGITVTATPAITVTLDTASNTIQIANTGNSQIRSVYASAKLQSSQSYAYQTFIGTLNVDDTGSLTSPSGSGAVDVKVTYKDTNNIEHTFSQTLSASQGVNITSSPNGPGGFNRNGSQRGGLFGLGSTSGSNGIGTLELIGAAVVVIVAGYFGYKRFWKPKQKDGHGKPLSPSAK